MIASLLMVLDSLELLLDEVLLEVLLEARRWRRWLRCFVIYAWLRCFYNGVSFVSKAYRVLPILF